MASTYFQGKVHTVVYDDSVASFYILKMILDDIPDEESGNAVQEMFGDGEKLTSNNNSREIITVRGHIPGLVIDVGTWFGFEAEWKNHEKFGKQLAIVHAPVIRNDWTPDVIMKTLESKGIPFRHLSIIRNHVGDSAFQSTIESIVCMVQIPDITQEKAESILKAWNSIKAYYKTLDFLNTMGVQAWKINQVWQEFGDEAEAMLATNPWALVRIEGFKFEQADEIAMRLNLDPNSPLRIQGAILSIVKESSNSGHMYQLTTDLLSAVSVIVPAITGELFARSLVALRDEKQIIMDRTTRKGTTAVYDPLLYKYEKDSAELLISRHKTATLPVDYRKRLQNVGPKTQSFVSLLGNPSVRAVAETAIDEWGEHSGIHLSDLQKKGVLNALIEPISVITGLPGTGKSLSMKALISILQDAGVSFLLVAPTGIAAKRLHNVTGALATTIHKAFGAKGTSDDGREATYAGVIGDLDSSGKADESEWGHGEHNPCSQDVIIIDETSMVDAHLLYRILTCTGPHCRLVFVGDYAQLPSVGPGSILRDLIYSNQYPTVRLTEIFRQKDTSAIIYASHAVHKGEMPEITQKGDFMLIPTDSEEVTALAIQRIACKLFENRTMFQILSPRHAGPCGVTRLNEILREKLNPKTPSLNEIRLGEDVIREDDRIMVIKNNYKLGICNGDTGKIVRVDRKSKQVQLKIHSDVPLLVTIPFGQVPKLIRLAFCVTVHKMQGIETDVVVIPVLDSFKHQLQRNLYYTAITRAKKRVILVGTENALYKAVMNSKEDARNSLFQDRLISGM